MEGSLGIGIVKWLVALLLPLRRVETYQYICLKRCYLDYANLEGLALVAWLTVPYSPHGSNYGVANFSFYWIWDFPVKASSTLRVKPSPTLSCKLIYYTLTPERLLAALQRFSRQCFRRRRSLSSLSLAIEFCPAHSRMLQRPLLQRPIGRGDSTICVAGLYGGV